VSDAELADLYARCRAVVYPPEEDFGLVPLEAQAAARPVIAFGRGGATETVRPLGPGVAEPTGLFFLRQDAASLAEAVRHFESVEDRFDPKAIRAHAERFSGARFQREIQAEVRELLDRSPAGGERRSRQ
jgi:glycosyltransferase involved in cell wall biosynthesis